MKRLVFIVEGDTEIILLDKVITPYLCSKGITNVTRQTITTNRKQHKKGGVGSFGLYRNEVERTLAQGDVVVTTLIDFFKLPTDFPNYSSDANYIDNIEQGILDEIGHKEIFIPYIQKHEVEALMFSNRDGFEFVVDDESQLKQLSNIIDQYPNPEDINNSPETAPSKRMGRIFPYDKTGDGEFILEVVGIDAMLERCPRFKSWIDKIIKHLIPETAQSTPNKIPNR